VVSATRAAARRSRPSSLGPFSTRTARGRRVGPPHKADDPPRRGAKPSRSTSSPARERRSGGGHGARAQPDLRHASVGAGEREIGTMEGGRTARSSFFGGEMRRRFSVRGSFVGRLPKRRTTLGKRRSAATHDKRRQKKAKAGEERDIGSKGPSRLLPSASACRCARSHRPSSP
jgi:hypothetical protein